MKKPLTQEDVWEAADALAARGEHPTQDAVRAECGNRGSNSTIGPYLRAWHEKRDSNRRVVNFDLTDAQKELALVWIANLVREMRTSYDAVAAQVDGDVRRRETEMLLELEAAREEAEELSALCDQQKQDAQAAAVLSANMVQKIAMQYGVIEDLKTRMREQKAAIAELRKMIDHRRPRVTKAKPKSAAIAEPAINPN